MLWLDATFPSNVGWSALPGRRTSINQHAARVYSGAALDTCPDGTGTEIEANVRIATHPIPNTHNYRGNRIAMTACIGPHAPPTVDRAVTKMLNSLRIREAYWS